MATDKPFTFSYDATTGIYMVNALREKARAERREAREHHGKTEGKLSDHYALLMVQAQNRAKLMEDAAKEIHEGIRKQLVADFDAAFEKRGE